MKRKILLTCSIIVILVAGCSPSSEELAITTIAQTDAASVLTLAAIPTDTPTPTNTPAPTETPTPTPVPPTPTPEFEQFYTEEFDKDLNYWPSFTVDGSGYGGALIAKEQSDKIRLSIEDSFLRFDIEKTWQWVYASYDPFEYEDVRLDSRVENQGTNMNFVSLICRYTENEGWYEFNISNSGIYSILYAKVRPEDGYVSYTLISEGGSNKVIQGHNVNEYSIICKGDTLTLYINDNLTKETTDNRLATGKVGISLGSFSQLPVIASFDWIKISQP